MLQIKHQIAKVILSLFMILAQSCSTNVTVAVISWLVCVTWIWLIKAIKYSGEKILISCTERELQPTDNVAKSQSKKRLQYKPHWLDSLIRPVCAPMEDQRHNCGWRYGKTDEADYRVLHSYHPQHWEYEWAILFHLQWGPGYIFHWWHCNNTLLE